MVTAGTHRDRGAPELSRGARTRVSAGRCGGRAGRGAAGGAAAALRGLGALLPSGRVPGPAAELLGGRRSRSWGTGGRKPSSLGEVPGAASEAWRSPAAR